MKRTVSSRRRIVRSLLQPDRQTDTDRHRQTQTDTNRHRHAHTHAHTRTSTHTRGDRVESAVEEAHSKKLALTHHTHTSTHTHIQTHIHTHTHLHTHPERHTPRDNTHRHTLRGKQPDSAVEEAHGEELAVSGERQRQHVVLHRHAARHTLGVSTHTCSEGEACSAHTHALRVREHTHSLRVSAHKERREKRSG
eukprot:746517-Rhodomonas_salina.1